ncbi:MAG: type II toxin-antitoxin system VapC family toxin [Nitrososphaerota archaeon]|nr:type II toxin-antitoxin system VapC family toxin [Nitrososphaerota archaeon]MDG6919927.1 type II toxin-antitoxin system VapC family toxin [Nitrososphaerota archaeon]
MAILRGDKDAAERLKTLEAGGEALTATAVTAYELLKGARMSARAEQNTSKVVALSRRLEVLPVGEREAELASSIYAKHAPKGKMMGEFDVLIAAVAKENSEALLTRDEAFRGVEGLKTLRW